MIDEEKVIPETYSGKVKLLKGGKVMTTGPILLMHGNQVGVHYGGLIVRFWRGNGMPVCEKDEGLTIERADTSRQEGAGEGPAPAQGVLL